MTIGRCGIDTLRDDIMKVDGGTMQGLVPKTRWEEYRKPDRRNRISGGGLGGNRPDSRFRGTDGRSRD